MLAVVDTGPLYAVVDASDQDHLPSLDVLQSSRYRLVVPAMVVAETTYLVGRRLGAVVEAAFLAGLRDLDVLATLPGERERISQLVHQYASFPLGGTDASVIALAERLGTDVIVTLDRRHFDAVRPRHRPAWRLLPD